MTSGTVKFYNDQKGFGFIQPDEAGNDVFVHATALERSGITGLNEGQKVVFSTEVDSRSGKTAVSTIELA
ncbi:cold-shock protein [uncultured Roseibium sp.]|uniref:cold-shock protein n=1 Tax=uncultured Roseibium sp. TaxID=1936171 RepID=UPI00260FACC8|nr:cold-shock protein [uncultured Roseibium sp.]